MLGVLGAQTARRLDHRAQLSLGHFARKVLHAAIGREDDVFLRHVGQGALDARHHLLGRLHRHVVQVEAADHDRLAGQLRQHRAVETGLRGFDRHLPAAAAGELGQERVARGPLVHHRRVAEADVHGSRAGDAVQRAIEDLQPILARLLRSRLHIGLVHLHDVGAGGKQIPDLLVHRDGVVHRRLFIGLVEVVLRLLHHGEGTGYGHLHLARRVSLEELQILDLHRVPAPDAAGDARHGHGLAGAVHRRARLVEVDALERGGEAVGIAFAPDFAVGDDVQARRLLRLDGEDRGVILRLREMLGGNAPQLLRAHARRQAREQLRAVEQPLGLRVAADQGSREQQAHSGIWLSTNIARSSGCGAPKRPNQRA
jgi:hypothetical protein